MKFFTKPKDCTQWRRRFAFEPTRVGTRKDGKAVWVWLGFYEHRVAHWTIDDTTWERRPVGRSDIVPYRYDIGYI